MTGLATIIRCATCGRYLLLEDAFKERFCSQPCSFSYTRCEVCGQYFRGRRGATRCSAECTANYRLVRRPTARPTVELVEQGGEAELPAPIPVRSDQPRGLSFQATE